MLIISYIKNHTPYPYKFVKAYSCIKSMQKKKPLRASLRSDILSLRPGFRHVPSMGNGNVIDKSDPGQVGVHGWLIESHCSGADLRWLYYSTLLNNHESPICLDSIAESTTTYQILEFVATSP